jgi:hypothetical protein
LSIAALNLIYDVFFKSHQKFGIDETKIIGTWTFINGRVRTDQNCKRIGHLILSELVKKTISKESGGWETLYQDPCDLRFWELTYPQSCWQGGGPPALINLTEDEAKKKYNFDLADGDPWMR